MSSPMAVIRPRFALSPIRLRSSTFPLLAVTRERPGEAGRFWPLSQLTRTPSHDWR